MATTEVGYNEALVSSMVEKHHIRIADNDLPTPYNTMSQTRLYLRNLTGETVVVGQAAAHQLDSNAPIYCVNTEHDILLYPMSTTDKAFLTPLAHFGRHQATLHSGTVITVNKQLVASGDTSGCIWLWQPSSHPAVEVPGKDSKQDKKIKKVKRPFFQSLSKRKQKVQRNSASSDNQVTAKTTTATSDYQPRCYHEHQYPITSMVTIDHQRFMSSDSHGVIKLWHINEPQSINTWVAENHSIHSLSWSNGHCRFVSTLTLVEDQFYQISEIHGDHIQTVCSYLGKPFSQNSDGVLFHLSHHQLVAITGRDSDATMQVLWLSDNPAPSADIRVGAYDCRQNDLPFFSATGAYGFFKPHHKASQIEITQPLTQTSFDDVPGVQARFP